jgi:hypothetical protein
MGIRLQQWENSAKTTAALGKHCTSLHWRDGGFAGWGARKATTRMVQPWRGKQCLPKEDATRQRDANDPTISRRGLASPLLPDPASRPSRALGSRGAALLGIVVPATAFVARLMIAPDFTDNPLNENLFSAYLVSRGAAMYNHRFFPVINGSLILTQ